MVMVNYGHQGEEAIISVANFKIICAMGVERRDKSSALFHIIEIYIKKLEDKLNQTFYTDRFLDGRRPAQRFPHMCMYLTSLKQKNSGLLYEILY